MTSPADVVNRALDAIGRSDLIIGDLEEGTEGAKVALRAYGPGLRQMLRCAHWDFARKQSALTLLADATGQTPGVGTLVPSPWTYEYALPVDCMKVRFLPWNSTPIAPNPPIMTGLNQPPLNAVRLMPARFLVALDGNYPVLNGPVTDWAGVPDWAGTAGTGPIERTVILTNVPPTPPTSPTTIPPSQSPQLVYTSLVVYPSQWDSLFEEAFVAYLAQKLAMALAKKDRDSQRAALAIRNEMIKTAKDMIGQARAVNGNESAFPQTVDHVPDFIRIRNAGAGRYASGYGMGWDQNGPGSMWGGWDSLGWADGSVY